jgi:predicted TIM-barrel fold metal-dependent hydrolase
MDRRSFLALPVVGRALSQTLYGTLHGSLERLETFDTHEHFPAEAIRLKDKVDFFSFATHYAINDATSAGLPDDDLRLIRDPDVPASRKWAAFEPYWKYVRGTGFGQALCLAVREVYGIAEITAGSLPRINAAIAEGNKPGIYRNILKTKARVAHALNDAVVSPADMPLLLPARRFDHLIVPRDLALVEKLTNTSITTFAGLKRAIEDHFARAVKENMVAIKSALAYSRAIRFEDVPERDAAAEFERGPSNPPSRKVADHLFHHLMQLAEAHRIPVQIHTGMLAGNRPEMGRTRPVLLTNVLTKYSRVRFDLFHAGYPYHREVVVLAKQLPNVHADLCWMHIVAPSVARTVLHEMLDAVPANKIMGFGGDYRYPELSYAHLIMARRNIATVLAERVESGASSEEDAAAVGRWLLADNPARLFVLTRR